MNSLLHMNRVGYFDTGSPINAKDPSFLYSSGFEGTRVRYSAGMIWSVSMLSPTT